MPKPTLICFPSPKTLRRLTYRTSLFRLDDGSYYCSRHRSRDLVLYREDLCDIAIIAFRPYVPDRLGFDKPGGNSNTVATAADAAF